MSKLLMEITDKVEFSRIVDEAVNFFITGKYPEETKHIEFINRFLELHSPIPKEDLLCEAWNKVGLDLKGKGQVTTPMLICDHMNKNTIGPTFKKNKGRPIHILDPACGSGIFAISAYNLYHKHKQWKDCYFQQVDVDPLATKMTILNLMIRNFHAIVWEADTLLGNTKHYEEFGKSMPKAWYLHPQRKISSIHQLSEEDAIKTWNLWYGKEHSGAKNNKKKGERLRQAERQGVLFKVPPSQKIAKSPNEQKRIKKSCSNDCTEQEQKSLF